MARSVAVARFLAAVPPAVAASFNDAQLAAIDLHFGMRFRAAHLIDWRRRFGFARWRVYAVVLVGRDRHAA
ncbi:hypothetical protein AruPA_11110 [Acidiphilium sp. PA]|jgi:hypothetical protein|uniref:hypothetical protein n=1 Tax=Acidiphilium sp. PA TaxID=2871705 RepID=UPI0022442735|nr:hypothetical protein [Acidiphilium sp. PA]MCW8307588.1 hypothetical protein [Acidiphilium sp. PA]